MKHRDLFGTDPNFPGLPYTVSASVANIRDNMLAVRKSLDVLNIDEAKCLMQALSTLEDLFSELQARFAPKRTLEDLFNEAQRDHENSMAKAVASGLAGEEPVGCPGPDLVDKDSMISVLASLGIDYYPEFTLVKVGGKDTHTTSTGNAALDVYDLAAALMDGEVTTLEAVAKLVHIGELLANKEGMQEDVEYFMRRLERIHALKTGKRPACQCSAKTGG